MSIVPKDLYTRSAGRVMPRPTMRFWKERTSRGRGRCRWLIPVLTAARRQVCRTCNNFHDIAFLKRWIWTRG